MSQLLQAATRAGLRVTDGIGAPAFVSQGIPYAAPGVLAVENVGAIDHYHQGLPYTAAGRLCTALNGLVARIGNGGAPFSSTELLSVGTGAVAHYSAGIPYTANNQLAVTII